jgi:phospholipase/carboxylesterase
MINNFHTKDFSKGKPQNIVFILHGYGADGENLADLASYFAPSLQSPLFIVPDAPFPYEHMPQMGRQWFSLIERDESKMLQGAEIAHRILVSFIEENLKKYELSWENVIFIGFSQGCMMSIYTSLKLPQKCKGVLGFSGTMISSVETIESLQTKPQICMVHGADDNVVACALGKFTAKTLKNIDVPCEFHELPSLSHSIDERGIKIGQEFLKSL